MNDPLAMRKLREGCPVLIFEIPKPIQDELDGWVKESKKFKDHPLAPLKAQLKSLLTLELELRKLVVMPWAVKRLRALQKLVFVEG